MLFSLNSTALMVCAGFARCKHRGYLQVRAGRPDLPRELSSPATAPVARKRRGADDRAGVLQPRQLGGDPKNGCLLSANDSDDEAIPLTVLAAREPISLRARAATPTGRNCANSRPADPASQAMNPPSSPNCSPPPSPASKHPLVSQWHCVSCGRV